MSLALLHRRLVAAMALAALLAYAAGAGASTGLTLAAAGIGVSLFWLPPPEVSAWLERISRIGVVVLCGWAAYSSLVLAQDFLGPVLGMLLFLLVTESLRSLEAKNDVRLYSLSFALLIAATAWYPGLGFGAGFTAFVALATLAMMVGFLRRQAERFQVADLRIGRRFLWTTAALSGVTLAMSAILFVVFPRLPRQWSVQGRRGAGEEMAGFSDRVSIGEFGGRIASNPEVMLRVEFPDGPPPGMGAIHWRGRSFDAFDGEAWTRTRSALITDLQPWQYGQRWGGPFRQMRIFGGPPGAPVLFGPHPVLRVQPRSAVRSYRDPTGDLVFYGSDNPVYTVVSTAARPSDDVLRGAAQAAAVEERIFRRYRQLPRLDPRIPRLADSLAAPHAARIDQVRAVEGWLQREFGYTLDLPRSRREAGLAAFLFDRREGHCEYFSTAMVVLLRARGIPARNVNGFLGGEWNANGRYLAVTGNDAHSWVEVWFPGWGWVPFDPTPPERAALVDRGGGSWRWAVRLWLDGMEYRWYKWVVDYNLERQLAVFRGVGEMFSRDRSEVDGGDGAWRRVLPWGLAAAALLALWWALRSRRRTPLPPESRAYLALRRAYARAGYELEGEGPLTFSRTVAADGAPGADAAARAVSLYLQGRFGARPLDDDARRDLLRHVVDAREALRKSGWRRGRRAESSRT